MVNVAIVGSTGGVGKEVVKYLVEYSLVHGVNAPKDTQTPPGCTAMPYLDKVFAYTRRDTAIDDFIKPEGRQPEMEEAFKKLVTPVKIDFSNIPPDFAKDCDVFISCLGSLVGQVGQAKQYEIDHDYAVNTAKKARENGCKMAGMCSSAGANPNSWFFYPKTRGQTEQDIKALDFDFFAIARPGIIRVERGKGRSIVEKAMVATTNMVDFGSYVSVKGSDIAGGLIYSIFSRLEATAPNQPPFDTYGSRTLSDLSSKLRSCLKVKGTKVETAPKLEVADASKAELESIPTEKGSEVASLISEDVKATDQVFTKG
eukprot:Protomagalhaensia_sp_Gyna_25__2159@NODE_2172_length_1245_cov_2238_526534_g1795_i0_p1_GENE_NODE_2172_length_1245_cov_2238_526534_g1795_i0NODE_2172_length_1245_cov_2238_526534_g1795_i0_p1_ORF_typecomplete_len331_score52_87HIM1/PF08732_10/3e24NAD_binding_10/PF13460_6/46NAD_binding_10/PF13460_6/1_6e09Semialdhyde_dh/PF01118_24/0_00015NmrA/PF05368_13/0_0047Sacchrp_dh_NADP/PF03435_18/0_25Sacchrp_dh_NADP/PF03435_18/1_7e03Sacchrp_dh_NADP/PF03435_18/2_7e03Epimerase/PF01370_21/0_021DapB_N/PF01113_20/0_11Da